jgi:ASC-1-like (ASCH) protein
VAKAHLVILHKEYLDLILAGRKKIESRLWKSKHPAFGRISAGDRLLFKISSGPVCAEAAIKAVKKFDKLTPAAIRRLKIQYNDLVCGSEQYWQSKRTCRYGILVWLKDVKIVEPVRINKKDWRAWVMLTPKENFGLLTEPLGMSQM